MGSDQNNQTGQTYPHKPWQEVDLTASCLLRPRHHILATRSLVYVTSTHSFHKF